MQIQVPYKGLCINVIIDGSLMLENLKIAGKDENWLKNELSTKNCGDYKQILLAYIDSQNQLIVYPRDCLNVPDPFM
jgi:uncharacterized membrane protein YcaP (DUF421 family)